MPKCPNCGRETLRTEDWACQWCGHPLLSGAFKQIPKTYREIQEERSASAQPAFEERPEPEPQPPPVPKPGPEMEPETPAPPKPETAVATGVVEEREPLPPPEPEAETVEDSEAAAGPEAEAAPAYEPGPAPEPIAETEPETEAAPAPEPVTAPEPEAEPAAVPTLEADPATGTIKATIAGLNAAFNSDKAVTNNKLMTKPLQVTGNVDKVFTRDNLDIFYILLAEAGKPSSWQVCCTFDREHSAPLSRLTEGQAATVQGTYVGYERNIILKDCSLIP